MKGPTKPNHFISPNSLSYCGMPLRRWVLRCHTTNWESQQGPLFGLLHRLCTATVITAIIWLLETSNGIVEAAGICIAPFDLGNLNKASSHSAQGVKVTTSCPPLFACHSCLCLTSIVVNILDTNATERYKSHIKDKYNPGLTKGLFTYYTQTETDIMLATYQQQSKRLGDGGLHFTEVVSLRSANQYEFLNINALVEDNLYTVCSWVGKLGLHICNTII